MTRKALARRIAELLFNEPATPRGAGAAPTRRLRGASRRENTPLWSLPTSNKAPGQNPRSPSGWARRASLRCCEANS